MTPADMPAGELRIRAPRRDEIGLFPNDAELKQYIFNKYGQYAEMGPSPRIRCTLRYAPADDIYEALVTKAVGPDTRWLDVGCGRNIFPSNYNGAKKLAQRAAKLVGVDPDDNIQENELLIDRFQGIIEEYDPDEQYDLVTMRMVAEHVQSPGRCVKKLAQLTAGGGRVVIYTPWKWAPMSMVASAVPFALHNPLKRLIWNSEERDTFPTAYKMNTRRELVNLFAKAGFREVLYAQLDDCSVMGNFQRLNSWEIRTRNLLLWMGLPYPEFCVLAVFERRGANVASVS